jgi:hypothetical protein
MSTVPVTTITIATCENVPVATMIYPLISIVVFCSSDNTMDLWPHKRSCLK